MLSELNFHKKNGIWNLIDVSLNHKVLTEHWVFKLKKNYLGNILKYKTQWIVHSYKQKFELNYENTFTIIIKLMSYKTFFIISALHNLNVQQMNIVIIFLFNFLNNIIYMKQFHYFTENFKICHLYKILYNFKQSPWV